jgi:hypothetical protein
MAKYVNGSYVGFDKEVEINDITNKEIALLARLSESMVSRLMRESELAGHSEGDCSVVGVSTDDLAVEE